MIGLEEVLPKKEDNTGGAQEPQQSNEHVETEFDEYVKKHADKDGNIIVKDSKGVPTKISAETLRQAPDIKAEHLATIENVLSSMDDTIEKFEAIKQKEEQEKERQDMLNNRIVTEDIKYEVGEETPHVEEVSHDDEVLDRTQIHDSEPERIYREESEPIEEHYQEETNDVVEEPVVNEEIIKEDEDTDERMVDEDNPIVREINEDEGEGSDVESSEVPDPETILMSYSDYVKEEKKHKKKKKTIDLSSIKIKKTNKNKKDLNKTYTNMVNDIKNRNTWREVLPISGYIANMAGLSSIELRNIESTLNQMEKNATTFEVLEYKYRMVYELISRCSLGKLSFTQFLKNTALVEFDILMHGVYGATNGDTVTFPRTCNECGAEYVCNIKTQDMLYVPKEDKEEYDKMYDEVMKTGMLKVPTILNRVDRIILDDCGIIVDIRQPTLYNQLYDISKNIANEKQEQSTLMNAMPFIKRILVEDPSDGTYVEINDFGKIFDILSKSLTEDDDGILAAAVLKRIEENKVLFVTKIPKCPNVKCGYVAEKPIDIVSMESMVFLVHQMKLLMKE